MQRQAMRHWVDTRISVAVRATVMLMFPLTVDAMSVESAA